MRYRERINGRNLGRVRGAEREGARAGQDPLSPAVQPAGADVGPAAATGALSAATGRPERTLWRGAQGGVGPVADGRRTSPFVRTFLGKMRWKGA